MSRRHTHSVTPNHSNTNLDGGTLTDRWWYSDDYRDTHGDRSHRNPDTDFYTYTPGDSAPCS